MTLDEIFRAYRSRDADRFLLASEVLVKKYASGLSADEVAELADAIASSGDTVQLPEDLGPYADVPSTGGPTSLSTLLCPYLLAAKGFCVPKISASGSIAGAIDTLMLIPGYRADLNSRSFERALRTAGIAHSLQSEQLCPADRVLIQVRRRKSAMRHSKLLTASLLSKKLVVPGTVAVFDFRLGKAGNVADTLQEGEDIAEFFLSVANRLGILAAIVLTNGESYSCSAVGRLESLGLLVSILQCKSMPLSLDTRHAQVCEDISNVAEKLVQKARTHVENRRQMAGTRSTWQVFTAHLESQGSGIAQLNAAIQERAEQQVVVVSVAAGGYWVPPNLQVVKAWIKKNQAVVDKELSNSTLPVAARQMGLCLLVEPGDLVSANQPVVELRYPKDYKRPVESELLCGTTTANPIEIKKQILGTVH